MTMTQKVYVLDTNTISALRQGKNPELWKKLKTHNQDMLCLCEPVIFEVERGFEHRNATKQIQVFREELVPLFIVVAPELVDWRVAAKLWGYARQRGRQFSDVDVLLAAMTLRLNGVLVTDDRDFDYLNIISTENWLKT